MTPKEKAIDLYNQYFELVEAYSERQQHENAVKAAIIAVDLIIKSNPHSNPFNTEVYSTMDYWNEVKQELEKL